MKKVVIATAAIALASIALPIGIGHAADKPAPKFTLSSPAMKDGGFMPEKYVNNNPTSKNCSGQNVALPLAWKNAPAATKSFAITMVDPVPRGGMGFVHWVAYDIQSGKTGLKEGEANNPTDFVGGKNGAGSGAWAGPCAPLTDSPHPYTITLVATDIAPGTLKPGMTRDELVAALQGHALGTTTFIARYHKP